MDLPDCTTFEPATSDYVFAVLRDLHRYQTGGRKELLRDMLIDDWELESDFEGWKDIARGMNWFWEIDCPLDEWRTVLLPMGEMRLRDVCDFIAQRAKRPAVTPLNLLGRDCLPAGAFLAIRSRLNKCETGIKCVTPSTPLAQCRYPLMVASQVSLLAPGLLPIPQIVFPLATVAALGMLIGLVSAAVGIVLMILAIDEGSWLAAACGGLALVIFPASLALHQYARPLSVSFGRFSTFGDLAKAIARSHA